MIHRSDKAAKDIVKNIRATPGFSVVYTNGAPGTPDAFVGHRTPFRRWVHALEMKSLGGNLSDSQLKFIVEWQGCIHVATSSALALVAIEECESMKWSVT